MNVRKFGRARKGARKLQTPEERAMMRCKLRTPEERAAMIGKVVLNRTADLVDLHREAASCTPSHAGWDPYGFNCLPIGANPLLLGVAIAADIGEAMVRDIRAIADPKVRAVMRRELLRDLRIVRRPWYYARETARRRRLAAERRKIRRRTTTNPCPTPEVLLAAWNARKESKEAMIRLGGLLQDLECYVDNALRFDEYGNVVGRNGGIRGWLREVVPELAPKYKTLMRYKAMAIRLRQATGTMDPVPTDAVLDAPRGDVMTAIFAEKGETFAALERAIERWISPDAVFQERMSPH